MNSIIPSSLFCDVFLYSYLLISLRLSENLIYDFFLNFLFKNLNKEKDIKIISINLGHLFVFLCKQGLYGQLSLLTGKFQYRLQALCPYQNELSR